MSEKLIRAWVRAALYEASLAKSEMQKYDWRWDTFLKKITSSPPIPFEIDPKDREKYGGVSSIVIPSAGNDALMAALKSKDASAYENAFSSGGVRAYADGEPIVITAAGHLYKDKDFGGRGGTPLSIQNEIDFANAVDWAYSASEVPITVQIGKHQVANVVAAEPAGQTKVEIGRTFDEAGNEVILTETSKADVNLILADNTKYPVSIKMPTAQYWLSGDAKLKDVIAPILQTLEVALAPNPRLIKDAEGNYQMVQGPDENPVGINVKFELPPDVAMEAVFGSDRNPVGIVAKGDFISDPTWDGENSVLKWGDGTTYRREDGIANLPDHEKPTGLLRKGEKKSGGTARRGTAGYPGIRPAVASAKRAAKAVIVSPSSSPSSTQDTPDSPALDVAHRIYDDLRLVIREALLAEELTKSDKKEIERIARKQAKKEIDKVVGTSLEKTIQKEVEKTLKNKASKEEMSKISKAVIKKLYRELSFSYPQVIDRIKV